MRARALLLLVATCGCAHLDTLFQRPTVSFQRMEITQVSFSGLASTFHFAVDNPNSIGVTLARLGYQLTVDGHDLAEGKGDKPLSVPAHGTGQLALPVTIRFLDFAQSIRTLIEKQEVPFGIRAQFGFDTPIGVIDIPAATQGTLPMPQVPKFDFQSASVQKMGMTSADLELAIQVSNRNPFPLSLGELPYQVSLEGVPVAKGALDAAPLSSGGTSMLRLPVRVSFLEAGAAVIKAVRAGSGKVQFDGKIDLGGGASWPVVLARTLGR